MCHVDLQASRKPLPTIPETEMDLSSSVRSETDLQMSDLSMSDNVQNQASLSQDQSRDCMPSLSTLHELNQLIRLPASWSSQVGDDIRYYKVYSVPCTSRQPLVISHCLTVHNNRSWSLFVFNQPVNAQTCNALKSIPSVVSAEHLQELINLVDRLKVCAGHPDNHLVDMCRNKKGKFLSAKGDVVAVVDEYAPVELDGSLFSATVRNVNCELLVHGQKCEVCKRYRPTLRSMYNRQSKRDSEGLSSDSSHANYRYLNTPEKLLRIKNLKSRADTAEQEAQKVLARLEKIVQTHGETVDRALHDEFKTIMEENNDGICDAFPAGSFRRLFWEQQLKAATSKDPRSMRWHPMLIKWCLNLKLISSASYHALRTSGFITLPSERTLRDYSNFIKSKAGFQQEVNDQLCKEANVDSLPKEKKYIVLALDEMKVKEDLIYDKLEEEIIGFVRIGDINDQLLEFERRCSQDGDQDTHPPVAKHLLVFLVRGLFFKLEFPYAHFATDSLSADLLFPIVWEAVRQLESMGFKVIAITADGASVNRKFFRMHASDTTSGVVYKTKKSICI